MSLRYREPSMEASESYHTSDDNVRVTCLRSGLRLWQGGFAVDLTQQNAAELLPLLHHFARTGTLPGPGEDVFVSTTLHQWVKVPDESGDRCCSICRVWWSAGKPEPQNVCGPIEEEPAP